MKGNTITTFKTISLVFRINPQTHIFLGKHYLGRALKILSTWSGRTGQLKRNSKKIKRVNLKIICLFSGKEHRLSTANAKWKMEPIMQMKAEYLSDQIMKIWLIIIFACRITVWVGGIRKIKIIKRIPLHIRIKDAARINFSDNLNKK